MAQARRSEGAAGSVGVEHRSEGHAVSPAVPRPRRCLPRALGERIRQQTGGSHPLDVKRTLRCRCVGRCFINAACSEQVTWPVFMSCGGLMLAAFTSPPVLVLAVPLAVLCAPIIVVARWLVRGRLQSQVDLRLGQVRTEALVPPFPGAADRAMPIHRAASVQPLHLLEPLAEEPGPGPSGPAFGVMASGDTTATPLHLPNVRPVAGSGKPETAHKFPGGTGHPMRPARGPGAWHPRPLVSSRC